MFGQSFSLPKVILGTVIALTLTAAPTLAAGHGGGHGGGGHAGGGHAGGGYHGGGYHGGGYAGGGYRGGAYRGGYAGGYRGGNYGYRGGNYGYRGGYYGGYGLGGLGLGLGYYGLGLGGYSGYDNSYYDNYYTPPVVDYSPSTYYVTPPAATVVGPDTADYSTPTPVDDSAHVDVMVPSPDAQVLFNGSPTRQTGTDRAFVSPPLTPGQTYHYTIEARWNEGGRMVDETRTVTVTAGQAATVDFTH